MKELTDQASSQGSNQGLGEYLKERPNYSAGYQTGQKLQTTVRFEAPILQEIEDISDKHGFSLAEAVRRLVKQALRGEER